MAGQPFHHSDSAFGIIDELDIAVRETVTGLANEFEASPAGPETGQAVQQVESDPDLEAAMAMAREQQAERDLEMQHEQEQELEYG